MANGPTNALDDVTFVPPAQVSAPTVQAPAQSAPDMGDVTFTPPSQAPPVPSLMDKAHELAEKVVSIMPGVGPAHELAGVVQDWAAKKMAPGGPVSRSPLATFGTGVARDVAGLVHGATSPEGIATTVGAVVAPEVVGPVLIAHGLYSGARGWGDLRDPDVLQKELMAGAEIAGGAAAATVGAQGLKQSMAASKAAKAPEQHFTDFKNAVPPSKSTPYADADYHAARPYLEAEHTAGTPVSSVESLRDGADSAIGKIEARIDTAIKGHPQETITTNPVNQVRTALEGNVKLDFLAQGLKELENYPLGFERAEGVVDPPLTLERADNIRQQLNADNRAILKKNNYDVATARATDPAFAAREVAAESLRNGVYDKLVELGFKDARQLRWDEGSLIKIRNAAQNQIFNAEKQVKASAKMGTVKRLVRAAAPAVGAAGGFEVGAAVGHPLIGAAMGAEAGRLAGAALIPEALTRDALVQRSFTPVPEAAPRVRATPTSNPPAESPHEPLSKDEYVFHATDKFRADDIRKNGLREGSYFWTRDPAEMSKRGGVGVAPISGNRADLRYFAVPKSEIKSIPADEADYHAQQGIAEGKYLRSGKSHQPIEVDHSGRPYEAVAPKVEKQTEPAPEEKPAEAASDYKSAAEKSGVEFRGVQEGIEGAHPGLVIFQDPKSTTSVAVRLDQWSPEKLQEHVDAARKRMSPKKLPQTTKALGHEK